MHYFSYMFFSILHMFRAAMCPSSGELIVSMRHLVYVTLYTVDDRLVCRSECHSDLHTRRSYTQSDIQGVTGGMDQTSGECSLGHTIPI